MQKTNLGKCKLDECDFNICECLICIHFITFLSRIHAFEQKIMEYNDKIKNSENILEIEELNMEKKLLGKYLSEMYKMELKKGNSI